MERIENWDRDLDIWLDFCIHWDERFWLAKILLLLKILMSFWWKPILTFELNRWLFESAHGHYLGFSTLETLALRRWILRTSWMTIYLVQQRDTTMYLDHDETSANPNHYQQHTQQDSSRAETTRVELNFHFQFWSSQRENAFDSEETRYPY